MSNTAEFRFYEELNDFLPPVQRKTIFTYTFNGNPGIKDAIEACGVPHTEVEIILANSVSVGFEYKLRHNDRIAVYPVFESMDISPLVRLRSKPLRESRFILDVHLGKLSRLLRMAGFDTLYRNDYEDDEIIDIARKEHRIILTRDRGILKNSRVTHGAYLHHTEPEQQLKEILDRLDLRGQANPFSRCIECNGLLEPVDKHEIHDRIPPKTEQYFNEFHQCTGCGNVYWHGSHYENMLKRIRKLVDG